MAKKHPFGPEAKKVEKQVFAAEKIKARLQIALKHISGGGGRS